VIPILQKKIRVRRTGHVLFVIDENLGRKFEIISDEKERYKQDTIDAQL
jgi:hypothetical protein